MSKTIVLNHKMNLDYDQVFEYINYLNKIETDNNIIVCPSNLYLETFINNCSWGIGCQNFYYEVKGDYTGEISTTQLKSLGIEYGMIGHHERKKYFKESNKDINLKLLSCLDSNIIPILFIEENDIDKQLKEYLKNINHIEFIIFAYEIFDKDVDISYIKERIDYISNLLENKYKVKPTLLYGGNIDNNNINEILNISNVSGVVIGSDSSKIEVIDNLIK